ncbi:MAG: shikimate dehydrogenase [Flavobacteriaceae bacterium]|nr:shikimate dehydrogenase [Flavobacteriaceae bacterium]
MGKKRLNRQFGLIGKDIFYSFSEGYFSEKFNKLQIEDCRYRNYDLAQLEHIESVFKIPNLVGLNVTIPYKEKVIQYLDSISSEAETIGAVNVIHLTKDNKKIGYNTDCYGFEKSLYEAIDVLPNKALILGTGGASKAVGYVLKKNKISFTFVSRKPKSNNQISYHSLKSQIFNQPLLIVNTTPLGTVPDIMSHPPIPYQYLCERHILYDLVYNPEITSFLKRGINKGTKIIGGLKMLIYQAEKAWEIWNK